MVGPSKYLKLSTTVNLAFVNSTLHLNVFRRQLEIHFDLSISATGLESYKIILPLKFINPDSFVVNSSKLELDCYAIFFDMTVAPQIWKKSHEGDMEDLNDRLQWSENEQWIRQCDVATDASDPSFSVMDTRVIMKHLVMPVGKSPFHSAADTCEGRWKAYCLHLSEGSTEDGTEMTELLEILKLFNIKISERPLDVTSSVGESLGVNIEDELQGLPYNVRYSFDVCVAHGYLYHISSPSLILLRTEYTICKRFIERLKALPSTTACGILDTIAAGLKFVSDPLAHLATAETTYKGAYRIDSDRDLPAYCKRIQRCLITPTSVLLKSPSIDVTNRVIRHFIRYLDRFLRVTCTCSLCCYLTL